MRRWEAQGEEIVAKRLITEKRYQSSHITGETLGDLSEHPKLSVETKKTRPRVEAMPTSKGKEGIRLPQQDLKPSLNSN